MSDMFDPSYEALPYLVRAHAQTAPDRLATLARLHGLATPPVTACRVLELGCAAGGNLIPLAQVLPGSTFVGVDTSARQIADGKATAAALELPNVTLQHISLTEIDAAWGQFDYIIAHGLYSWVPAAVREHILRICGHNLAPNGVAYISYNTYPGWSVFVTLRDALFYHTRDMSDPLQRVEAARKMLNFLAEADGDYSLMEERPVKMAARFFRWKVDTLGPDGDSYLLHELLEEVNEPLYFSQFVDQVQQHGLQYLSEARLSDTLMTAFPRSSAQAIAGVARDAVELGQYMDFLRDQTFRQTLLCHAAVPLNRGLDLPVVLDLYATSRAVPESEAPDLRPDVVERFRDQENGIAFDTEHPLTKAAMLYLRHRWPQAVAFDELVMAAASQLGGPAGAMPNPDDIPTLAANLVRSYSVSTGLVNLHTFAPTVASGINERPVASPLARRQARGQNVVTNVYHDMIALDPAGRFLLPLLDGTRDHVALGEALAGFVAEQTRNAALSEELGSETETPPIDAQLRDSLALLARSALLVE